MKKGTKQGKVQIGQCVVLLLLCLPSAFLSVFGEKKGKEVFDKRHNNIK